MSWFGGAHRCKSVGYISHAIYMPIDGNAGENGLQRSKVVDELYQYQGENLRPAHCRVRVYVGKDLAPVVIVTECDDNPGASITTAADTLYPRIIAKYLPGWLDQAEELILIEHYVGLGGEWGRRQRDTFDRVTFSS